MRKMIIAAALVAFPFATVAQAQQAVTPAAPQASPPAAASPGGNGEMPTQAPAITTINIVEMEALPDATKAQIDTAVSQRSEQDVKQLRSSIDASPQVSAALKEKGLTSAEVVVASLDSKGLLTLITKKSS